MCAGHIKICPRCATLVLCAGVGIFWNDVILGVAFPQNLRVGNGRVDLIVDPEVQKLPMNHTNVDVKLDVVWVGIIIIIIYFIAKILGCSDDFNDLKVLLPSSDVLRITSLPREAE